MELSWQETVEWKMLARRRAFRYLFAAMLTSLFGSGMNFAGVAWYILEQTQSTVQVSLAVILVTLPGLVVPALGGVLIDRVDRRYLGLTLDLARGAIVLATAALFFAGQARLWHIYAMVMLLGVGFAIYWATMTALVQEVVPQGQLVTANAAVLIAVQGGLMTAGAVVGFIYEYAGIDGILVIDGITYLASALLLARMRSGTVSPRGHGAVVEPPTLLTAGEEDLLSPAIAQSGFAESFWADLNEGLGYLRGQPRVFALGLTYACMMAGVLSANVLVVALARDVLGAGPRGYGYLEASWALGAIVAGIATGAMVRRVRPLTLLILSLVTLAVGHTLFPYVRYLALAVAMNALFGGCRALGGVVTQSSLMTVVPRRLMGRTQSAFSVISTLLQVLMSFTLGWLAQYSGLPIAFAVLGLLYGAAVLAALRLRAVTSAVQSS